MRISFRMGGMLVLLLMLLVVAAVTLVVLNPAVFGTPTPAPSVDTRVGGQVQVGGGGKGVVATGGGGGGSVGTFDPVPAWAQRGDLVPSAVEANSRRMAQANKSGGLDVVQYGDSITAYHVADPSVWKRTFPRGLAMGIPASTIEELMWRIGSGNERPAKAPRAIILAIGVVNCMKFPNIADSVSHYEFLVKWLRKAYPTAKLVCQSVLPTTKALNVPQMNAAIKKIAERNGATYASCGQDMNPRDARLYSDELHPVRGGYEVVLPCVAKFV